MSVIQSKLSIVFRCRRTGVRELYEKEKNHRTLSTNWRSDKPLLDNLNNAFSRVSFGDGIDYREVTASEDHQESCLVGEIKPLEIIHLGKTDSQQSLVGPTVGKVIHLLDNVRLIPRVRRNHDN